MTPSSPFKNGINPPPPFNLNETMHVHIVPQKTIQISGGTLNQYTVNCYPPYYKDDMIPADCAPEDAIKSGHLSNQATYNS